MQGTHIDTATQWLATQQPQMERLLEELVNISSWTHDKAGVDAAMAVLRKATPLPWVSIESKKFGNHTLFQGHTPATNGGVLLVGHMDTVFPKEKFVGYTVDGNIARGPGVLDMKGGLVIVAFALQALKQANLLEKSKLSFIVVSEEEVGSPDSCEHLLKAATGAKAALVFESGRKGDAIITRRKGTGFLTAVAHGKAAHAGNAHEEGINAIWAMSRFVDRVQQITDYSKGTTVNVGTFKGGIGKNTVPDLAETQIDLRFVTDEEGDLAKKRILEASKDLGVEGALLEVYFGPGRGPMKKTPQSEALMNAYAVCQKESGLGSTEMGLVGGGSDAAHTAAIGIPSIDGLGPRGSGFHTLDEYVQLDSLIPKAQALVRYLVRNAIED